MSIEKGAAGIHGLPSDPKLPADPAEGMGIDSVKEPGKDKDDPQAEQRSFDLCSGKPPVIGKQDHPVQEGHGGHADEGREFENISALLAQLL